MDMGDMRSVDLGFLKRRKLPTVDFPQEHHWGGGAGEEGHQDIQHFWFRTERHWPERRVVVESFIFRP